MPTKILIACEITMGLDVESARYVYDVLLRCENAKGSLTLSVTQRV